MEQLNVSIFFSIITIILLVVVLGKAIILKKANTLLSQQLTETSNSLEITKKNLATLREKQQQLNEFHNNLSDAELSTRIHKSRTIGADTGRARTTPERYGYIHSLASKGLSSDEIASVLTISTHEARQLVALARIAQGN